MPYAIEILLDEVSASMVREVWSRLAEVAGGDYILRNGVYPHVAIAVLDDLGEPVRLQDMLGSLAQGVQPASLRQTGIAYFQSQRPVVYLGFARTGFLERLHAQVQVVLTSHGLSNNEYYQWNQWQPHCTLAMEFEAENLEAVAATAKAVEWNVPFRAAALGMIEYPPTKLTWSSPLGGKVNNRP